MAIFQHMNQIAFRGAKGGGDGGGSAPQPVRTPDNLRSEDAFEIILGLAEGPIEGCDEFYIGDTLLVNADGTTNFKDFILNVYAGDALPNYVIKPTLGGASRGHSVNTSLYSGVPVIRQTDTGQLDFIDVRMVVQGLYRQDNNGVYGSEVTFTLEYKALSETQWRPGFESYAWSSFTPPGPTADRVTGVQFTVQATVNASTGAYDCLVERRPSGGSWATLQHLVGTVPQQQVVLTWTTDEFGNQIPASYGWAYPSTVSLSGTVTDLAPNAYELRVTGGSFSGAQAYVPQPVTISGKTSSSYVKEFRFPVERINEAYQIRVTKLSAEDEDGVVRSLAWESYQEIVAEQYTFPNTAVAHLTGRASNQFSSLPDFKGVYRGLKVKVPSNYDPVTKTYSGLWDGTFNVAWTDNPAWCLYDFVTNTNYGIAAYYPIYLDKYAIYDAGVWCDERVSDGSCRYTFNSVISDPRSSREQAAYMAGVFNGTFFDDQNGTAYLRVDKDEPAVHLFTEENTVDGFHYSFTDLSTRYNDITVTFVNPELGWNQDRRRVPDDDDIAENGRIPLDFIAIGCTSEKEAIRRARYKLLTSLTECMSVSFKTNRLGCHVQPWEIVLVADPTLGYAISGRFRALNVARTVLTLRDAVYLEAGVSYIIKFDHAGAIVERQLVSPTAGPNLSLTLNEALPSNIPEYCTFSIEGGDLGTPKPFRVMKVEEADGNPDAWTITAVEVNRNKWADVDNYTQTNVIQYSSLDDALSVPGPTQVNFTEVFVKSTRDFYLLVNPTFDRTKFRYYRQEFEVWSRPVSGGAFERRTVVNGDTIVNHPAGDYEFRVLGKSFVGGTTNLNNAKSFFYSVTNPAEPPSDVPWVMVNGEWLTWTYPDPPLDFAGFEVRYHFGGRLSWSDAVKAHPGSLVAAPPFNLRQIPAQANVILVRAVDFFDNASANSAYVLRNVGDPVTNNVVETFDFKSAGFTGSVLNGEVVGGNLTTTDAPGSTFYTSSGVPKYSGVSSQAFYKVPQLTLTYVDSFTLEASGNLVMDYTISGGCPYSLHYREYGHQNMYSGGSVYSGNSSASMYAQSAWLPLPPSVYVPPGRYQIKLEVSAGSPKSVVSKYRALIDVDDVVEYLSDVTISPGGTRLPITKQFTSIKTVNCTLQFDGGVGYSVRVIDKDADLGPLVQIVDSAGVGTSGVIDVYLQGYYR